MNRFVLAIAAFFVPFFAYGGTPTQVQFGVDRTVSPWSVCAYDSTNTCQPFLNLPSTGGGAYIPASHGGSGTTGLTGYLYGNGSNAATASTTIPTNALAGYLLAAQFPALTGDVTSTAGSLATSIAAGAVTSAKIGAGAVNLATQVTGNLSTSNLASGTNATSSTYWRGDGTWNTPSGNVSAIGTPTSGQLAEWTGATTVQGFSLGTGVGTAIGINVGSSGSPVVNGGALGTPSGGTLTNATGLPLAGLSNLNSGLLTPLQNSPSGTSNTLLETNGSATSLTGIFPNDVVNVKSAPYNAQGNGTTDDTSAINSAIAAVMAAGGGTVRIPASSACYKVSAPVAVNTSSVSTRFGERIQIVGDGQASTCITGAFAGNLLSYTGLAANEEAYFSVSGLRLAGSGTSGSTGLSIDIAAFFHLSDIDIEGFSTGLSGTDLEQGKIESSEIRFNLAGAVFNAESCCTGPNSITFVNTAVGNNSVTGITFTQGINLNYYGGSIQVVPEDQ